MAGAVCLAVAILVGWKRDWAMDLFDGTVGSSESSAVNERLDSNADHVSDLGPDGDAGGH